MWDTDTMTRAESIAQVAMMVDATSYPQVSTTEIGAQLDIFLRFATWTAATAYAVGDSIVPTTPYGRVYQCIVPGTSGTNQPDFPEHPNWQYKGWSVTDGTSTPTLQWVDAGPANVERYDVRTIARQLWLVKASRCAADIDAKEGASDVKLSQLMAHCLTMAERFRPMVIV